MSLMPTVPPANTDRAPLALVPGLPLAGNMPGGPARRAGGGRAPEHRPADRRDLPGRAGRPADLAPSPRRGEGRGGEQSDPAAPRNAWRARPAPTDIAPSPRGGEGRGEGQTARRREHRT